MKRRKKTAYYITRVGIILVLTLIGIPLGLVISGFGLDHNFLTPGLFVAGCIRWLWPETGDWTIALALVASGLVDSFCCFALIYAVCVVSDYLTDDSGTAENRPLRYLKTVGMPTQPSRLTLRRCYASLHTLNPTVISLIGICRQLSATLR